MARVLLDTSLLIELERGRLVLGHFVDLDDEVTVAAISVAELLVAPFRLEGPERAAARLAVDGVLEGMEVVPYDAAVAEAHAELIVVTRRSGRPRGSHDLIVAATARTTGRIVLTTDAGFAELPGVAARILPRA